MLNITHSVGKSGENLELDVSIIQTALNKVKPALSSVPLNINGVNDEELVSAIIAFQKKFLAMEHPDGRIDPGGRTIRQLNQETELKNSVSSIHQPILFPLNDKAKNDYKTGMGAYGSNRSDGKRKHAGVDLYADKGKPIRAMKDGRVIQSYPFYLGTSALEIDHGDMLIRYGEISHVAEGIKAGVNVKRGQLIAYVGELKFSSGSKMSMLHLEAYRGTSTGSLTVRSAKPYQRRDDLFDPTELLNSAEMQ
jgi:murein DD-endopeptidase MepM/ murein hydrolase activator NlpD